MGAREDRHPAIKVLTEGRAHALDAARSAGKRRGQSRAISRTHSLPRDLPVLWLIPLTIAAAFLIVFVVDLPRNIAELAWDPDYASGFTVPETLAKAGTGGNTVLSDAGQWVPLWFGLLTARLPLHRELWGVAPTLLFVATAFIVGWSVSQVAGRRAAIFAVLLGLVASTRGLWFFMGAVAHNTVYPCTALVGAYLVWLGGGGRHGRLAAWAAPALAGLLVGVCLASDLLVAATTVVPLGLTALVAGLRRERRSRIVGLSALLSIAVAIPVAALTTSIMEAQGYRTLPTPRTIAHLAELPARARLLFKGLKDLFNGYLGSSGGPGAFHVPLGIACTIVMSIMLLALLAMGIRTTLEFVSRGMHANCSQTAAELQRSLHIIYWVSAALSACGAFWIAAIGPEVTHESYYGTVIFAVAAVIPLLPSARPIVRWLIPVGAAIYFTGSLVGLTSNYMDSWLYSGVSRIRQIADAYHVTTGYSGYSQSNLTWTTDGRLVVRPVMTCSNPAGVDVCPFLEERVPSWYIPQRRHTFLLVNTEEGWLNALPPGLGQPLAAYSFGRYQMYVFPYDIASLFGPLQ